MGSPLHTPDTVRPDSGLSAGLPCPLATPPTFLIGDSAARVACPLADAARRRGLHRATLPRIKSLPRNRWHNACCREAVAWRPANVETFAEIYETQGKIFMRKSLISTMLAALLALGAAPSFAAAVNYAVTYDGAVSGPAGTGSFTYNAATGMMDNFVWDFGGGKIGGVVESELDGSFFPGGDSVGKLIFDTLTTVNTNFGTTNVYGSPIEAVNFHQTPSDTSGEYVFFLDDLSVYKGTASVTALGEVPTDPVPEPSSLLLIGVGLLAAAAARGRAA
jgi:PEP-CTERM motif